MKLIANTTHKKTAKNLSAAFHVYINKIKTAYIEYKLS